MKKVFITGVQGSGKSSVMEELQKRGYQVLDSDTISRWVDQNGVPLKEKRPQDPSYEWLKTHAWVWDQEKLRAYLNTKGEQFILCGISWDQDRYYSFLDTVILLYIDEETVRKRIQTRDNGNIFGKKPNELKIILERVIHFQDAAKAAGAIVIDARQPLENVIDEIIAQL